MVIVGQANLRESYFFDMVAAFYLDVATVKNFVRGNNFPVPIFG